MGTCISYASPIVLIRSGQPNLAESQVTRTAEFLGLDLVTVDIEGGPRKTMLLPSGRVQAIMISYRVLHELDPLQIAALSHKLGSSAPILIFDVTADDAERQLSRWSNGTVRGCAETDLAAPQFLEVSRSSPLSKGLAGSQLPVVDSPVCSLIFENLATLESVLAIRKGSETVPVLLRTRFGVAQMFFIPRMQEVDRTWIGRPDALTQAFSFAAPLLLFMSFVSGNQKWHLDGSYGNFTIDDPWLVQPYGRLDYAGLLQQMEKHNFHTTIGFIPWNFDRSRSDTIKLIRSNPTRFSISIHGNNHAHREFGDYAENPLQDQIANIKQAVARMERFRSNTGITYDRFMIFPHGVAPAATFAALKKYEFLGTANSLNVPLGTAFPTDPFFLFRPYTCDYGNLLSLFRYSAETPIVPVQIAIHAFLGNPLLFYGHEAMFEQGTGAFDKTADLVNDIAPRTKWTSLGEIARHLYLIRSREDGSSDVTMFANEVDLTNTTNENLLFHVRSVRGAFDDMQSVAADGLPLLSSQCVGSLAFDLVVSAHSMKRVKIAQKNDLDVSREDVRTTGLRVFTLRMASDFRDLYLSRSRLGNAMAHTYYRAELDSTTRFLERTWWLGVLLPFLGLPLILLWRSKQHAAKRGATKGSIN